jgi:cobalt-zinc-cadmium efflux system outer membrane protein
MRPILVPFVIAAVLSSPLMVHAGPAVGVATTGANHAESGPQATPPITLDQAWQLAEDANATLRQARAQRAAVEGELADASALLWNNPRLSAERMRREVPQAGMAPETRRESAFGLEQTFEIAGQQGLRRKASQQQLQAMEAVVEETRLQVRAEVEQRFVRVLSIQERIATESASVKIIEDTAASTAKRVAAGEDSRLDGNLAKVEAVRARNQIALLQEQLTQARAELGATLQLPTAQLPSVTGALVATEPVYTLAQLQESAAARPLLRSLEHREQAAKSRLSLERAARYPDLTLALSSGREGPSAARERLTGLTLSLPLPLFRRNAGEIGRAATALTQAQIEQDTERRNSHASIAALWQQLQSLNARVDALQTAVLPALEENQRLSVKSLQAGEISLVQLLLVNRQMLEGRRDTIDALTEQRLTQVALRQAAGWITPAAAR